MDPNYPKQISKGFAGIPSNIDAAFVWSGNGKIYFTKGSKYWRFDPTRVPPVKESYPYDLSNWDGLPNNLDDALQYSNEYTYFFKVSRANLWSIVNVICSKNYNSSIFWTFSPKFGYHSPIFLSLHSGRSVLSVQRPGVQGRQRRSSLPTTSRLLVVRLPIFLISGKLFDFQLTEKYRCSI